MGSDLKKQNHPIDPGGSKMKIAEATSAGEREATRQKGIYRVMLPLTSEQEARLLLPLAEILVQEQKGQLIILNTQSVPKDETLSSAASQASRFRETLNSLVSELILINPQIQTMVMHENEIWEGLWDAVGEQGIQLLLLGWTSASLEETALGILIDKHLALPTCNVAAIRPAANLANFGWLGIQNILMPVRGGPHSTLTLRIGYALAHHSNASISLMHVSDPESPEQEALFISEFSPAIQSLQNITRTITARGDVSKAITAEASRHDLVVMGAPRAWDENTGWSGNILQNVLASTDQSVIVVKEYSAPAILPKRREEPVFITRDRPIAFVVDRWFAENTFHSREFQDLERLYALKQEQGVSISLGLPALNEEETVGDVIQTVKAALMEQIPLLDEIVLIDSGSEDGTREIAADLGIPVYIHQEILPQYGAFRGKGEALWKSLYVLKGDIVGWIDTDISNIHPRFVFGILGPLLRQPKVKYVKGFYRRPLKDANKYVAGGGGRVTELTARPFFNLFFPELSGLIQPLSGEYAGRRAALEQMPFFTGYGVETGLLIDILNEFGLESLAQVDLLERIHHNQPLPSLSKMSFAIMQVVLKRLEKRHRRQILEESNLTMNLIRYGKRRRYYLETEEIVERERSPIIELPEYRKKRGMPPIDGQIREDGLVQNEWSVQK
jgi:glycosyltransferase involved in cell wall biosynthesis/nucleotide-binding universal stress UspA family protein